MNTTFKTAADFRKSLEARLQFIAAKTGGADFLLDQVEMISGANWLEFCKIPAPIIPMISIEQQFAEKLHAYTLPRGDRFNSRVKDLIDMVLLLNMRAPKPDEM